MPQVMLAVFSFIVMITMGAYNGYSNDENGVDVVYVVPHVLYVINC
jgi:hypothetical protein